MDLQVGDLIEVRGTGFIARLIERITKSKYSHVAVYVGDGQVIEAQGCRTVGTQRLSVYEGCYDVYRTVKPLTEAQEAALSNYLASQVAKDVHYDYLDIVALFVYYTFHLRFPYHETRRLICETLARNAYQAAGVPVPSVDLSPGDLATCPVFQKVA